MGRTVTLTARVRDRAGHTVTKTAKLTVPLLVGMDAPNGGEWTTAVSQYPGMTYSRDFGSGSPTNLTAFGAGKFATLPGNAVMHCSWKGNVEQLSTWMNNLNQRIYLTWYHEPMGDVDPATYRATAARMAQIIAGHPKKKFVLGNGPIVTRYWLDEKAGNPLDWWYEGANIYGIDCYQDTPTGAAYWGTSKMFGTVFNKVRYAIPGVRLLVPEYGVTRLNSDNVAGDPNAGKGRAQAIRDHIAWLRLQQDVEAVAYFNSSAFPNYQIASASPEGQAWRDMQAV